MKNRTMLFIVVLVALSISVGQGFGDVIIPLTSFEDFADPGVATRTIQMETGNFLGFKDPVTGVVTSVGLDGTDWHIGFFDEGGYGVGWSQNVRVTRSGWEGWFLGKYTSDLLNYDSDKKPNSVLILNDRNGDGMGTFNLTSGVWNLAPDDILYTGDDLMIEGVRGNISAFPAYDAPGRALIMPDPIFIVPEPATLVLLSFGGFAVLRRRRGQPLK